MFPIKGNYPYGPYKYGTPTFYGNKHLGVDIMTPQGVALYAPFKGMVKYVKGSMDTQGGGGGHMAYFYPDGKPEVIRFLHLIAKPIEGSMEEGQIFGSTGSTGTKTPHLHLDIAKSKNFNINKLDDFIDPDKYNWNPKITMKIKILANNTPWFNSQHMDELSNWYKDKSNGKIELALDLERTALANVPFSNNQIGKDWYDQNVLPKCLGSDIALLLVNPSQWQAPNWGRMTGDSLQKTMKIEMTIAEIESVRQVMFKMAHEISHALFALTSQYDPTHDYFNQGDNEIDAQKIFSDLNFQTLSDVLAIRRKEMFMPLIKTQDLNGEKRIVLQADKEITWEALCKVFGKDPKVAEEKVKPA